MKDKLLALGHRAWNDFRGFSVGQKAVTICAAIALVVGGFLFLTWKSTPAYAPLYTNLAPSDASAIVDKLNSQKIPYQLGAAGTEILVPKSKVYTTRLTISAAGLPASKNTGYSLLDKVGVTTSEFMQQVDYQRAIEGELANTIQAMDGVSAATVHLAIPQQNVFNDGSQKPTAAVMVSTAPGATLTTEQVQSIVYLVSSSVPSMDANGVTVTDSAGHVLSAPGSGVTDATASGTQTQATQNYNTRLSNNLQNMISQVVGAGHAVVTVNANLDFNKTSTTSSSYTYDPKAPPLSQQQTTEKYTGSGGTSGVLGATTGTATSIPTGAGSYTKTSTTKDNALGTVTTTTQNAPGAVNKLAIAVLLDSSVPNVQATAIQSLVQSAVGFNAKRGDTLAVQSLPFDTSQAKTSAAASATAAKAAAAKKAHESLMAMVRQGVLALLVLGLLIGTWLANRKRKRRGGGPALTRDQPEQPAPAADAAPATELPTLAATDQSQLEIAARRHALVELADEQPRHVAQALSSWLN
jgi:flagellar M-ring protein FliF